MWESTFSFCDGNESKLFHLKYKKNNIKSNITYAHIKLDVFTEDKNNLFVIIFG